MCILEAATKSMNSGASYLYTGAQTIVGTVAQVPLFLNRHFVNLTNKVLPPSFAKFTQEAVYALPVTLAMQTLPAHAVSAAVLTYVLATVVIGSLSNSASNTLWTGIRNHHALNAARNIADYAASAQAPVANVAIANIFFAWVTNMFISNRQDDEQSQSESDELSSVAS